MKKDILLHEKRPMCSSSDETHLNRLGLNHIGSINVMKFLAIIFVIITHVTISFETRNKYLFPLWISMAVPIFMVISGFTLSLSMDRQKMHSLKECYAISNMTRRASRILIPFSIVFAFEVVWRITQKNILYNVQSLVQGFLIGGYGSGAYYVSILFQMLFVFPLCFWLVKKYKSRGLVVLILAHIAFELIVYFFNIPEEPYRLMIFRYIAYIALGIYTYFNYKKDHISIVFLTLSFVAGFSYIIAVRYMGYQPILYRHWVNTALPSAFYVFPIIFLVVHYTHKKNRMSRKPFPLVRSVQFIGKASLHIFLVQKVYFYLQIDNMLAMKKIGVIMVSILICTFIGVVFYFIESEIRAAIINRQNKRGNSVCVLPSKKA